MPLPMLPATPGIETSTAESFLDTFIHEGLPAFALWAGLMAVIWIACAVITLAGAFTAGILVITIQEVIHACVRYVQRRPDVEDDTQPVTVDAENAHAMSATIDRDRDRDRDRQRRRRRCHDVPSNDTFQTRSQHDPRVDTRSTVD